MRSRTSTRYVTTTVIPRHPSSVRWVGVVPSVLRSPRRVVPLECLGASPVCGSLHLDPRVPVSRIDGVGGLPERPRRSSGEGQFRDTGEWKLVLPERYRQEDEESLLEHRPAPRPVLIVLKDVLCQVSLSQSSPFRGFLVPLRDATPGSRNGRVTESGGYGSPFPTAPPTRDEVSL